MTSVGSGSLMIVLLLFAYPVLAAGQLVGTDLTQAVPLTAAAALGALLFGHVQFGLTTAVIIGSVPAVLIGSFLSSRAPDKYIRPVITFVIFASGLKYAGLGTHRAGLGLCLVLLAAAVTGWPGTSPGAGAAPPPGTTAHAASETAGGRPARPPRGRPARRPGGALKWWPASSKPGAARRSGKTAAPRGMSVRGTAGRPAAGADILGR